MNAREFVNDYINTKIPEGELVKLGLSDSFVNNLNKCYIVPEKRIYVNTGNELSNLIYNFDVSNIEIGLIRFNNVLKDNDNFIFIGKIEIDDIILNKETFEIEVYEFGTKHFLWSCAKNASTFLESLIICNTFFNNRIIDDGLWENMQETSKVIKDCTNIVGGTKYSDFYKMLLGYY